MIYTCQHCGAWFDAKDLESAIKNNDSTIVCKYCGNPNEIGNMKTSHIAEGYKHLEIGDFYSASMEFGEAIRKARDLDITGKAAFLEAYLGHALAQFSVQVIYADEIADASNPPDVNCYIANEMYFEDCHEYQMAMQIAEHVSSQPGRSKETERIARFAKIIDGIKRVYDEKSRTGTEYQLFIAYDDQAADWQTHFTVANRVKTEMPDKVNKVFLPMIDDYLNDIEYEGSILYAIHNSNAMLVVTGNDLDVRLMNIYSRYYWAMTTCQDKYKKKELGFITYQNKIQIHLPDHNVSNNVFELDGAPHYHKLVYDANSWIYTGTFVDAPPPPKPPEGPGGSGGNEGKDNHSLNGAEAPVFEGNICKFGSYPQRLVRDVKINDQFKNITKPTMANANGWTEMFKGRDGRPYTWYLDKEIDGKKYRAVFFMKFREVFTIRNSDLPPSVQRMAQYVPMRIYVFAYEPVEWNVLDISTRTAVLTSAVGLDCREFNNCNLTSNWECSTIREWLNNDFLNAAFNEEQKKYIFTHDYETVSLIDSDIDFGKKLYRDKIDSYNINGSDYFRCIGGFCDRNVNNFWIKNHCEYDDKAAAIQPHSVSHIVPQCVDNTAVSVVPKIIVRYSE